MIADSSLMAWEVIQESTPKRRSQVYTALRILCERQGFGTLREVCQMLRLPPNSVSGRITELRKMMYVYVDGLVQQQGSTFRRYKCR